MRYRAASVPARGRRSAVALDAPAQRWPSFATQPPGQRLHPGPGRLTAEDAGGQDLPGQDAAHPGSRCAGGDVVTDCVAVEVEVLSTTPTGSPASSMSWRSSSAAERPVAEPAGLGALGSRCRSVSLARFR